MNHVDRRLRFASTSARRIPSVPLPLTWRVAWASASLPVSLGACAARANKLAQKRKGVRKNFGPPAASWRSHGEESHENRPDTFCPPYGLLAPNPPRTGLTPEGDADKCQTPLDYEQPLHGYNSAIARRAEHWRTSRQWPPSSPCAPRPNAEPSTRLCLTTRRSTGFSIVLRPPPASRLAWGRPLPSCSAPDDPVFRGSVHVPIIPVATTSARHIHRIRRLFRPHH